MIRAATWAGLAVGVAIIACGDAGTSGPSGGAGSSSGGSDAGLGDAGHPPTDGAGPGSDGAPPPPDDAGSITAAYEAEDAFSAGTAAVATSIAGYSGAGYVDALGAPSAKLVFAVAAAADGPAPVTLWIHDGGVARTIAIHVNGAKVADAAIAATTGGGFVAHVDTLPLRAGLNTIAYVDEDGSSGAVSVDRLELGNGAPRPARGAIVPFVEYEAEAAQSTGVAVGPDRAYGTVAAEASGRRAVRLDADGQSVEWTTTADASGLTIRFSVPDAPTGGGALTSVSLYVDGQKRASLSLSSKYAWVYGAYPYDDDPSHGSPHHYFDEAQVLFASGVVPAGSKVRLQRDPGDGPVTIDLVDLELVPAAYPMPAGALSLTDFGAVADDPLDDTSALRDAITAAKSAGKVLWIPEGHFSISARVDVDHVTIRGAGPWRSFFTGNNGKGGFNGVGDDVGLFDFAIFGDVTHRDDQNFDSGIDGTLGHRSFVQNVWFEHTKVGAWLTNASGAYVVGCRVHDTFADGVNLNGGTNHSSVEHVHVRNTGDDAFALWADAGGTDGNRFTWDSARLPMLANGFGLYGGSDNGVYDSDAADTVNASAGVAISTRFDPTTPFGGTTQVQRVTLTRTGGHEPNWNADFGGVWLYTTTSAIAAPIALRDVRVVDSTYQGILFSADPSAKPIDGARLSGVTIDGAGSYGIEAEVNGSATLDGVTVTGAASGGSKIASGFVVTRGIGNSGW